MLVKLKTPKYALGPALIHLKAELCRGAHGSTFFFWSCFVSAHEENEHLLITLELEREEVAPGREALLLPSTGQRRK